MLMMKLSKTNATKNSVRQNTILNNLYKEFTCTICLQLFNDPVTVSLCKHTYCQDCLKQWKVKSKQSTNKTFKCPLCKNITTNRSYYSNEKYALAVKFLIELNGYMESTRDIDTSYNSNEDQIVILQKFLNDCIKYKLDYENDAPEIKLGLNYKSTKINDTENANVDDDYDDDDVLITESEENEFILNYCSTAENINIIDKLENDFIDDLEKETKTNTKVFKDNCTKIPSPAKKKKNNDSTASTSMIKKTSDSAKKSVWSQMKTINHDIKKTSKYKRLKVTEKKPKNKSAEKKHTTRSSKNETVHLDVFDEYIAEKNASKIKPEGLVEIIDTNKENNVDDDIFLRSTQILNLDNLNPEVSIVKLDKRKSLDNTSKKEETIEKHKTPDKNVIVVDVDVHHFNDSVINVPVKPSQNKSSVDVIENTEELIQKPSKPKDSKLLNLNKEFKETLKKVSELKSSVLQSLEQNLKESDNILTDYSNLVNSDSLFSSESFGKSVQDKTKFKIPSSNVCSAPTLDTTPKESITFYNTAIPCLEKIKGYFEQLKLLSEQFTENSNVSDNSKETKSVNVDTQTDILKCPTCTYTFNLKTASNICRKNPDSNNEDFNEFLEDLKKDLSKNEPEPKATPSKEDTTKKRLKRILTPTESDSESSDYSKKSRNNSYQSKLLYRDDIDVCFHSSTSQIHSNIEPIKDKSNNHKITSSINSKTVSVENNRSSENTLEYLEQQYKNPIDLPSNNIPEKCPINTNIDNLLSGIDISTFENDFSTNKNNDPPKNQNNQQRTELSASLFTETQLAKPLNNQHQHQETKQNDNIPEDSIVDDSCESVEIFEDDIVDTTPQKPVESFIKHRANETESKVLTSNSQLELRKLQNQKINAVPSMTPDFLPLSNIDLNCGFFDNSKFVTKTQSTQSQQLNQNNVNIEETKKLNPILIVQNEEFSPLQLVKQQSYISKNKPEIAKHQSSILSYMNNSNSPRATPPKNTSTPTKRSESPILRGRPILSSPAIICTSRLQSDENSTVMTCASRLNAKYTNVFDKTVTHLIMKVDEDNCVVDQTIKYALAIAHGIWVLNYSWFVDSFNQNRLLPEEPYEVLDMSGIPGPQLSRLNRKNNLIFKDFVFCIAEPIVSATRADLEDVIINLGGEVKSSPNELKTIYGKHFLILAEGKCNEDFGNFELWKNKFKTMVVDIEWLSETVGRFGITSIRSYALCSDDNIESYGYPAALIAQIPETLTGT